MPFDSTGPGSIIPVRRVAPIYAQDVGDGTAGSNANLQSFVDARRFVRAKVANLSARNSLTSPQDGDLVLVLDNGSSQTQLDRYKSSTASWVTVAVEGGSGGGGGSASPAFKTPVRVATTAALPANSRATNVLTASVNGALAAIDGVTLALSDRILVKNEGTAANNGLYSVTSLGSGSTPWSLTRAEDADTESEMPSGSLVAISEGTANGDTLWQLTTNAAITLNTTSLTFARVGANADTLSGASSATAATASTVALRGSDGTLKASNHASIGAAGAAGTVVALDAGGKVPTAALPSTSGPLSRFMALGDLEAILAIETGGPIIDYVLVTAATTITAIDLLCPVSPTSGSIEIDVLCATISGGAFASLYSGNTKPSLACVGKASFATFTGSNLPNTTNIAAGSVLAVRLTAAPEGARDLYVTIR